MNKINEILVIKIGGEILKKTATLHLLCREIANLQQHIKIIIVHGGGQQVSDMEIKLGHTPQIVHGRRITNEQALDVIKMIIAGKINIEIVSALKSQGVSAIGLTGVDDGMLSVCRRPTQSIDYGFVGDIQKVNPKLILNLLDHHLIPVIAPMAADNKGVIYNINADTVASVIALSVDASQWIILSNVDGIYNNEGHTLSYLSSQQARTLIANGIISGGMIPKVEAILTAIESGIKSVHIINGFRSEKLSQFFLNKSLGTLISNDTSII